MAKEYDHLFVREDKDKADKRIERQIRKWFLKKKRKPDTYHYYREWYKFELVRHGVVVLEFKYKRSEYETFFYSRYYSADDRRWTHDEVRCWLYENGFELLRVPYEYGRRCDLRLECMTDKEYRKHCLDRDFPREKKDKKKVSARKVVNRVRRRAA